MRSLLTPNVRFVEVVEGGTQHDARGIAAGHVADGELRPVRHQRLGADQDAIAQRPHAVRVHQVGLIPDPFGIARQRRDAPIERLGEMAHRKGPLPALGMHGGKTIGRIDANEMLHGLG